MADVDRDLAAALKQALKTPRYFAFVVKGPAESKLLISKPPVPAKEVAAAKKELGGGRVFQGRCRGEEGTLVFETAAEPPGTLAKQLRAFIQSKAGLALPVKAQAAPDLAQEDEKAEQQASKTTPPDTVQSPPVDEAARFNARLKSLLTTLQKAPAEAAPRLKEIKARVPEANALAQNKQFDQANALLDKLEALVKQALTSVPSTPETTAVDGLATWQAARTAVVDQIRKVAATVARSKRPHADKVIIVLDSITKNLTPKPTSPQQVAELERYLKDDDVIAMAEKVPASLGTLKIREPLVQALAALKR